ncbi:MAG: hypothetical protein K6C08_10450 [Oscillospiraceae bacterium]|nr:hypothetical protein [Oscillospiraceae bacterium]
MSIYREQLLLRSKDVSMQRRLRTSRLFEILQEASIRHTEQLGMGREKTLDRGLLWMVTMQRADILRMPEYDEATTVESWPGITMHLLFPRYYRLLDAEGNTLISASALWTLVGSESRRVVFPEDYGIVIDGTLSGNEIPLPTPLKKAAGSASSAFTVPYSYLDLNGHMNNTRYFDLVEDSIPAPAEGLPLRQISAEYSGEARLGDHIDLTVENHGQSYLISGDTDRRIFRMHLVYGSM